MRVVRFCWHTVRVLAGVVIFSFRNRTPGFAFCSMISLFCITRGWSNTLLAKALGHRPRKFLSPGLLSSLPPDSLQAALAELRENGIVVLPGLIDIHTCERITDYLLTCSGRYSGDSLSNSDKSGSQFDRDRPLAAKFAIDSCELLGNDVLEKLACDESVLRAAQVYLGGAPVVDIATAWWTASSAGVPDSEAAQLFHFDMDRPRWLKLFVYLTDVGPDNGPHVFIPGTHQDGGIPAALLSKGYARLQDDDVAKCFPRNRWLEVVGSRGTVILEDTRGLHKGKPVSVGDRLIFQVEYASSLFGGAVSPIPYSSVRSSWLHDRVHKWRTVFSVFDPRST